MQVVIALLRALLRRLIATALGLLESEPLVEFLASQITRKLTQARKADDFTTKLFGDPSDIYSPSDESSLADTPNEEEDLENEDGAASFEIPNDEGLGSFRQHSSFNDWGMDDSDSEDENEEESEDDDESEEDDEAEELRQDEEGIEDGEDEEGDGPTEDNDVLTEVDPDGDGDYNDSDEDIINSILESEEGGYDQVPDGDEGERDAATLFNELLEDSDMPTGEESYELNEAGVESGAELSNEATDDEEDFLDYSADDSEVFLLDAAMLVNDTELFDDEFKTITSIDLGDAVSDELP